MVSPDLSAPRVVRAILAYGAVVMLASTFFTVLQVRIDQSIRDVIMVIVGAVITNAKDAVGFFFSTSQSSVDKNDMLSRKDEP